MSVTITALLPQAKHKQAKQAMIPHSDDPQIQTVINELYRLDPDGSIFAKVIRDSIDQLLDGHRTARFDYNDLYKTEKTYMGTVVEINLQKEFKFEGGNVTDYKIAGVEVDCKFSQHMGGWQLGSEMTNQLLLVVWAKDDESAWCAGIVRAKEEYLNHGRNRDDKTTLNKEGKAHITWLWPENRKLAENLLLHLDPDVRDRIMNAKTPGRSDTSVPARVNTLFREIQGRIIRRAVLATVAYEADDFMKRLRANGGSRTALQSEGIIILGHQELHPNVAKSLGLPKISKGELIAVRVIEVDGPTLDRPAAEINGKYYAIARKNDPVEPAPTL